MLRPQIQRCGAQGGLTKMAATKITWLQILARANYRLLDPVFFFRLVFQPEQGVITGNSCHQTSMAARVMPDQWEKKPRKRQQTLLNVFNQVWTQLKTLVNRIKKHGSLSREQRTTQPL